MYAVHTSNALPDAFVLKRPRILSATAAGLPFTEYLDLTLHTVALNCSASFAIICATSRLSAFNRVCKPWFEDTSVVVGDAGRRIPRIPSNAFRVQNQAVGSVHGQYSGHDWLAEGMPASLPTQLPHSLSAA